MVFPIEITCFLYHMYFLKYEFYVKEDEDEDDDNDYYTLQHSMEIGKFSMCIYYF